MYGKNRAIQIFHNFSRRQKSGSTTNYWQIFPNALDISLPLQYPAQLCIFCNVLRIGWQIGTRMWLQLWGSASLVINNSGRIPVGEVEEKNLLDNSLGDVH